MARRVVLGLSLTLLFCVTLGQAWGPPASLIFAAETPSTLPAKADGAGHEGAAVAPAQTVADKAGRANGEHSPASVDYWSLLFVLALSTLIGLGVIVKVSRLLHTPLMSLTNAISAIAVVGAIIVTGGEHPPGIRVLGFIALFASTTNIVSGFMITDRMLKMFKQPGKDVKP
ncbi:MAG: NAD(P) transhydrogenase subunit alpha [Candidatus Saccharimonas sp.]|nr:NAD(P) transhydrogenase subunit alpha [Planctomycetaceae bacterium]